MERGGKAHRQRSCSGAMKSGKMQRDGKATQNKVRGWLLPDYEQKEQREWEQMALNCITP